MFVNPLIRINHKSYFLSCFFSFLFVFYFIVSAFPLNVYADTVNDNVDFSQAYIYDVLTREMTEETPFVNSNREDFRMISDGVQAAMLGEGIAVAGGLALTGALNSSQANTLMKLGELGEKVHDDNSLNNDFMGEIRYYKGEPYYCDTKNARFFRLTDDMKNELSTSEKEDLIQAFVPSASEYQRASLLGRINQNNVNTLLYYTGEVPRGMSDLIDMYNENKNYSPVANSYDTATQKCFVYWYNRPYNQHKTMSSDKFITLDGQTLKFTLVGKAPSNYSNMPWGYACFYGRYVDTNTHNYYLKRHNAYFTAPSQSGNERITWYMPLRDVGSMSVSQILIGSFGDSTLPFSLPNAKQSLSSNCVYDYGNVVAPAFDDINDDVSDVWDDSFDGYLNGADEDGNVYVYNSAGDVTNNYYIYAPTISYIYNFNIDIDNSGGGSGGGDNGGGGSGGGDNGGGGSGDVNVTFPWTFDVAVPVEVIIPDEIPDVDIEPQLPTLNFGELKDVFPFCIPFDIWYSLAYFVDPDAQPVFDVPFVIAYQGTELINYNFHLDVREYGINQIVFYLRSVQVVGYVIFLAYLTFRRKD